jgi:hypothetical protein
MHLLWEIVVYDDAIEAYNTEVAFLKDLHKKQLGLAKKMAKGGLAFLIYLCDYLKLESFWQSWLKAGAIKAAEVLSVPVKKIPQTTNHVESFNGRIKGKYFAAYRCSGWLPQIDMWILTVVTKVLPSFFEKIQDKSTLDDYFNWLCHVGPLTVAKTIKAQANTQSVDNLDDQKILEDLLDDGDCDGDCAKEEDQSADEFEIELENTQNWGKTPDSPLMPLRAGTPGSPLTPLPEWYNKSAIAESPGSPLTPLPESYDNSLDDIEMEALALDIEDIIRAKSPDRSNEAVTCM